MGVIFKILKLYLLFDFKHNSKSNLLNKNLNLKLIIRITDYQILIK